jgi:hypothetical protein
MDAKRATGAGDEVPTELSGDRPSLAEIAVENLVGAAAGATTGVLAGPPGIVAGAVIGGAVGAAAAVVLHEDSVHQSAEEARRDREIGVIGGDIGAARPDAPPAQRGVFHAASLGMGAGGSVTPAEGMIQSLDEE